MDIVLALAAVPVIGIVVIHAARDRQITSRLFRDEPIVDHTAGVDQRQQQPAVGNPYPTLAFIERGLESGSGPLTTAANAAALESRARELVAAYWSDTAWTTGAVPWQAFDRVVTELTLFATVSPTQAAGIGASASQDRVAA